MRAVTALLVCLGLTLCGLFTLAQTSARAPAMAASSAHPANEPPHAPSFEYLGTLRAETGTRTVVENGPQGRARSGSSSVTASKARVSRRRCKRRPATGLPTGLTAPTGLTFA